MLSNRTNDAIEETVLILSKKEIEDILIWFTEETFVRLSKKIENAFDESTECLEIYKDGSYCPAMAITKQDMNIQA